mmetsp:Transcript_13977/g.24731  ORF Transcript_13977/g.24731 Transcript_13977/m.24731 type:complete len:155 (+) Transcript_13977:165-629(+)
MLAVASLFGTIFPNALGMRELERLGSVGLLLEMGHLPLLRYFIFSSVPSTCGPLMLVSTFMAKRTLQASRGSYSSTLFGNRWDLDVALVPSMRDTFRRKLFIFYGWTKCDALALQVCCVVASHLQSHYAFPFQTGQFSRQGNDGNIQAISVRHL